MKSFIKAVHQLAILSIFVLAVSAAAATVGVETPDGVVLPVQVTLQRDSTPRPTIIYMHGCSGLDGVFKEWARAIDSWGYNVVQPDSLTPRGVKTTCAISGLGKVTNHDRLVDLDAVAEWVTRQSWHKGKIGAIGFSMGGAAVMNIATEGGTDGYGSYENLHISAVVAYYPSCAELHARNATIPMQVHIGLADDWTPAKRCNQVKDAGTGEVHFYPDAHHAFDVIGFNHVNRFGHMVKYDPSAAKAAEAKTRVFFDGYLRK